MKKSKTIKLIMKIELTVTTNVDTKPHLIVQEIHNNLPSFDLVSKHGSIKKGSVGAFIRAIEKNGKETGFVFETPSYHKQLKKEKAHAKRH